jgi:hypothetical protein
VPGSAGYTAAHAAALHKALRAMRCPRLLARKPWRWHHALVSVVVGSVALALIGRVMGAG